MSTSPPIFSMYDQPMWDSIAEDRLKLQKCSSCGTFRYPPGPACPECLGMESTWEPVSGHGKILSWTVFHRQYLPAYPPPTLVLAVQLDEGPIMIVNMDHDEVSNVALDVPVALIYDDHPDGYRLVRCTTNVAG